MLLISSSLQCCGYILQGARLSLNTEKKKSLSRYKKCNIITSVTLTLYLHMNISVLKLICIFSKHKTLCIFSLTRCIHVILVNLLRFTHTTNNGCFFFLIFSNIIVRWETLGGFPLCFSPLGILLLNNHNITASLKSAG